MQRTEIVDKSSLFELVEFILADSKTEMYESYSEMEKELVQITDYTCFKEYFQCATNENKNHLGFGIYYPESKGIKIKEEFKLDPKRCGGKTYRYKFVGWGIIFIHLNLTDIDIIECRISVNSKKRAENWSTTYSNLGNPAIWEWKIVESNARKMINLLRKMAKPS